MTIHGLIELPSELHGGSGFTTRHGGSWQAWR